MSLPIPEAIQAAEKAVGQLVEECRKASSLHQQNPKAVAQVSRTGKWLLNAIASLRKALNTLGDEGDKQSA